jgi:prolyl oligopeptidase
MSESQSHETINRGKYAAPNASAAPGRGSAGGAPPAPGAAVTGERAGAAAGSASTAIAEPPSSAPSGSSARPPYPRTPRGDVVDRHHGEAVPDPYRWLEDAASPQTAAWVAAQNELTESCLAAVPAREEIRARLAETWNYPKLGVPFERGGLWFCSRNRGLQNQPVFYVMDAPDDEGRALIDPNALSADGTIAVGAISVSPDGSQVAYATASSGSDWLTWRVRDVASGDDFGEAIEWSKSEVADWAKDGSGFYYGALPSPGPGGEYRDAGGKRVFFHRPGTPAGEDEVIFDPAGEPMFPDFAVSTDGRYLILTLDRGIGPGGEVRVLDLARKDTGWRVLVPDGDTLAEVVATRDDTFFLLTDHEAGRRRIMAVGLANPARGHWREVVPAADDTLLEAHFFGGRLVCHYLRDGCSRLRVFELDGTFVRDIPVPDLVTLAGNAVRHELITGSPESDIVHFEVVSFTASASLYRHDLGTGQTTLVRGPAAALDPDAYVTERVSVTSADGTVLPMFLTRRRDLPRDGGARVLLYGYGGVGASTTPGFHPAWALWVERGGLLAVACLRGGGEYGRAWHDAGKLACKQNVFDDFCACARWLAGSGWSRPGRIAINGGSNGGLLVGACLTQHPELFGAAVSDVGVLDMLRYHRFTVGWLWKTEYGDPDDPEQYRWLRAYSPLHNVRPANYPPTMLTTGDHDDRVVPAHSYKFAAALQAAQRAGAPILLRVETGAGHGGGKPTVKAIAEAADRLTFYEYALGPTA